MLRKVAVPLCCSKSIDAHSYPGNARLNINPLIFAIQVAVIYTVDDCRVSRTSQTHFLVDLVTFGFRQSNLVSTPRESE